MGITRISPLVIDSISFSNTTTVIPSLASTDVAFTIPGGRSNYKSGEITILSVRAIIIPNTGFQGVRVHIRKDGPGTSFGDAFSRSAEAAYSGGFDDVKTPNTLSRAIFDSTGNNIKLVDGWVVGNQLKLKFKNFHGSLSKTLNITATGWLAR